MVHDRVVKKEDDKKNDKILDNEKDDAEDERWQRMNKFKKRR